MQTIIKLFLGCFFFAFIPNYGQPVDSIKEISSIDIKSIPKSSIQKFWLKLGEDSFNNPIKVPILMAKGDLEKPVLGLTAALHGNELNGIPIIQSVFEKIDVKNLKGIIIAIPGLNPTSTFNNKRRFIDDEDINRVFPGKKEGNRSQQMAFQIKEKIIKLLDYHVDMHTASFGRINSMYVRTDMSNDTLASMARLQVPDIILSNKGKPSFGTGNGQTMRATALQEGIYSITVEYGNPQVYQKEMIKRGTQGILNVMQWLKMIEGKIDIPEINDICTKSYWIYTDQGGLLDVAVELKQQLKKGDLIAVLKNPFGDVIKNYFAPEDGVVIGKSTNPINMTGGRIVHLGIFEK